MALLRRRTPSRFPFSVSPDEPDFSHAVVAVKWAADWEAEEFSLLVARGAEPPEKPRSSTMGNSKFSLDSKPCEVEKLFGPCH